MAWRKELGCEGRFAIVGGNNNDLEHIYTLFVFSHNMYECVSVNQRAAILVERLLLPTRGQAGGWPENEYIYKTYIAHAHAHAHDDDDDT